MSGNLIAVQRVDKNGKLVTRHVKSDSASGKGTSKIGAPKLPSAQPKQFQSEHIAMSDDPRVQAGEVLDRIVYKDKTDDSTTVFYRSRDNVIPGEFQQIRVQLNRPLAEGEDNKVASLVGYLFKTSFRVRSYYESTLVKGKDSPYSVILDADTDQSQTSNFSRAVNEFNTELPHMLNEGTPVRKTNRAGAGTQGTRLVPGFEEEDLAFEIYYDEVEGDHVKDIIAERGAEDIESIDAVLTHDVKPLSEGVL